MTVGGPVETHMMLLLQDPIDAVVEVRLVV